MRIRVLQALIGVLLLGLAVDLFLKQIMNGDRYYELSEHNRVRAVAEPATRGVLYDRNGAALVENTLIFDVVALPREISKNQEERLFAELSRLVDTPADLLRETYYQNIDYGLTSALLLEDIPRQTAFSLEERREGLPGIFVKTRPARRYPFGAVCAHVVGYVGKIRSQEFSRLKEEGYQVHDLIGRAGLERSCEDRLRGQTGGMQVEVNNKGAMIRVLNYQPPMRGEDIRTTLDIGLQQCIAREFGDESGAAVVMDARTGEVLALYSAPSYDPGIFMESGRGGELQQLFSDARAPLLNRALSSYAPGSIFKIITAYAGLAEKKVTAQTQFDCLGAFSLGNYKKHCWLHSGHGPISMSMAISVSCNVYFYHLALKLGDEAMARYCRDFGLGSATGIELPGESDGVVPDAQWKQAVLHKSWFGGDSLNMAIGQGYVLMSPLQAVKMVSIVANEGVSVQPHLLKKKDGELTSRRVCEKKLCAPIEEGMRNAVDAEYGTARNAAVPGVAVYGKTGTAQTGKNKTHAWFAGFARLSGKTVCVAVFVELGGHGGNRPALISREIIRYVATASENAGED